MFLAEWSGRRVATYAIVWIVGLPILTTAAALVGPMRTEVWALDSSRSARADSLFATLPDSQVSRARKAYLPSQSADFAIAIDPVLNVGWLPWLLPPALLVAAWLWSRRSTSRDA